MSSTKLKIAILGSGNIGTDLLVKTTRSKLLECVLFIGRRFCSQGMMKAKSMGIRISDERIQAIMHNPDCCDLVFDATSANDHINHWPLLKKLNKFVIDLTPSYLGQMIIPAINIKEIYKYKNVNMVSCGGQAAIPLAYEFTRIYPETEYIEITSSIASKSAGPATRVNIDEYIERTEEGVRLFTHCKRVKAILILNPAIPAVNMQVSLSFKMKYPDITKIRRALHKMEKRIQKYVQGYKIIVSPTCESNRVFTMITVRGLGDYLPSYAGNLDIMTCAAIATAEEYAKSKIIKD